MTKDQNVKILSLESGGTNFKLSEQKQILNFLKEDTDVEMKKDPSDESEKKVDRDSSVNDF